ncbi:MAG: permease [Phycisphaeraceae bacterium]
MQTIMDILANTWSMALSAAPWLTVGLIVAALIKVYVPSDWLTRFLRGRGGVIKAAFIGAPLPLCSCGVIPAALALRRQGASRASTMSFLVATPETGVDSVAVTYALLGPFMTIVRPISAILSAIVTGLIGAAIPEPDTVTGTSASAHGHADGCCSSKHRPDPEPNTSCCHSTPEVESEPTSSSCCQSTPPPEKQGAEGSSCCASSQAESEAEQKSCCSSAPSGGHARRPGVMVALLEAAGEILGDTVRWLVIGLFMAGAISAFVEPGQFSELGSGFGVMLLMTVVGIPMYICAVASTPLAASLLIAGLSPGAVLVFMLAGPATNVATLGVVRKELGTRYMAAYLIGVGASAIACGLATDAVAAVLDLNVAAQASEAHEHGLVPHWLAIACLVLLCVLAIKPLRLRMLTPTAHPA